MIQKDNSVLANPPVAKASLARPEKIRVIELWNSEYPDKLGFHHEELFDLYIESLQIHSHYLIYDQQEQIVGWSMLFNRDHKMWFAMIVDHEHQYSGHGKKLMNSMKQATNELNGWVIDHNNTTKSNSEAYISKKDYYLNHQFQVLEDSRLESPSISAVQIQWKKS